MPADPAVLAEVARLDVLRLRRRARRLRERVEAMTDISRGLVIYRAAELDLLRELAQRTDREAARLEAGPSRKKERRKTA